MRVLVTTQQGQLLEVRVNADDAAGTEATATESETASAPNPIAPEGKELIWGAGSFLVFLVIMRVYLFPKLKKGMDARYTGIREDFEQADATRQAAQSDVAKYEAALADVRAEAAGRIDAARQAARAKVRDQVAEAVSTVTARTTQLAVGKSPDGSVVREAVQQVMQSGAR